MIYASFYQGMKDSNFRVLVNEAEETDHLYKLYYFNALS